MQGASLPDKSIRICADRGGTFCDVHASYPDPENPEERKEIVVKLCEFGNEISSINLGLGWTHVFLVSQDPNNYNDAPTEGIRRVLEIV